MSAEPYSLPVPSLSEREGVSTVATVYAPGTLESHAAIEFSDGEREWREETDDALVAWTLVERLRLVSTALRLAVAYHDARDRDRTDTSGKCAAAYVDARERYEAALRLVPEVP